MWSSSKKIFFFFKKKGVCGWFFCLCGFSVPAEKARIVALMVARRALNHLSAYLATHSLIHTHLLTNSLPRSLHPLGRKKFEDSFVDKCSKYPFVQKYLDIQDTKDQQGLNRYMIFVYSDGGKGHLGGLGDRLGVLNFYFLFVYLFLLILTHSIRVY